MLKKRFACCNFFYRNFDKYVYLFLFFFTFCKNNTQLYKRSKADFDSFLLDYFRWRSSSDQNYVLSSMFCFIFSTLYFAARAPNLFTLSILHHWANQWQYFSQCDNFWPSMRYALHAMYRVRNVLLYEYFKTLLILWYYQKIEEHNI